MSVWEEIVDYTVPSNTTQIDFTGLNITKDDFIKIFVKSTLGAIAIYPNNQTTDTNYHVQLLTSNGSSVSAARVAANSLQAGGDDSGEIFGYLKLSEDDRFNIFANSNGASGSSIQNNFLYTTSSGVTFPNGITSLTFFGRSPNQLASGTRIQIYKLTAEKVADITVSSNTTQVDITGLNIDKGSEYLLVTDKPPVGGGGVNFGIYVNNETNRNNYYWQTIVANGSTQSAERRNDNLYLTSGDNWQDLSYTHFKLSNIGSFTWQSYNLLNVGTSSPWIYNIFSSLTSENITNVNELKIFSFGGGNIIPTNSRFQLYKLY